MEEGNEKFRVLLKASTNAVLGQNDKATITIVNLNKNGKCFFCLIYNMISNLNNKVNLYKHKSNLFLEDSNCVTDYTKCVTAEIVNEQNIH